MVIDLHHHWMPKRHFDELERYLGPEYRVRRESDRAFVFHGDEQYFMPTPTYFNLDRQIADMDAAGVDCAVLHVGLWQDWNASVEFAREINDELARVQSQHPDRFMGLVHAPMEAGGDMKDAVREFERGVRDLGLRGLAINTHVNGVPLDHRRFWPLYQKAHELNVPVVVHPASVPPHTDLLADYQLSNGLGRALDLTTASVRIMYSGILTQWPRLRFSMAHLGGAFFALKNRTDPQFFAKVLPAPGSAKHLADVDYNRVMGQMFFDTAPSLWGNAEILCAMEVLGGSQVVFGSDYPIRLQWMQDGMDRMNALPVSRADREKLLGHNAERLFNPW